MRLQAEVCVVGGGPAGSAIASRLAAFGHDVVLVEAESFPRPHIGESLAPSIIPLLDYLGLRDEVEYAGFLRPRGALVRWAGQTQLRSETFGEPGFQVDRARFDRILLQTAVAAGVRLIQPARALGLIRLGPSRWLLPLRRLSDNGPEQVEARFLVDACGRGGLIARRKRRLMPATVALYGYWCETALNGPESRVEAGSEQWYWGAPLPGGAFIATVFVSPSQLRAVNLQDVYRELLSRSHLLAGCLSGRQMSIVRACAAAACVDDEPVGEDWLKVGESALALDPLSSQGVQTAIASGIQGAVVVHTLLSVQKFRDTAIRFVRDRIAETAKRHSETARAFYREQEQHCPTPFWTSRAAFTSPLPPRRHLRIAMPILTDRVSVSPNTQFVYTPALCGDLIRPVKAILPPDSDTPIVFLADVPIAHLIERIVGVQTVQEVLDFWSRVQEPQFAARLLQWTIQHSVIVRVE